MSRITIGGQAVIEGVMMRSEKRYAVAVRRPDGKISVKKYPIKDSKINHIPFIRGVPRFVETLAMGIKSLTYSSQESSGEDVKLSKLEMAATFAFSMIMTIGLFYAAPLIVAKLLIGSRGVLFNIIDGIVRILIFLAYLSLISLLPDIRRIFQYHGAEHMTVAAYEDRQKLTVKNIRRYSTLHPRCGTNFILIVFVMSVFFFSFIPYSGLFQKFLYRIMLLPVIAAFSYEILRLAGKHYDNPVVRMIISPGLLLQKITTRKPDDKMIQVAMKALTSAL